MHIRPVSLCILVLLKGSTSFHIVDKLLRRILFPHRRRLLHTDPQQRLGSARDADEVMHHEWFESVDWARTAKVGVLVQYEVRVLHQLHYPECRRKITRTDIASFYSV